MAVVGSPIIIGGSGGGGGSATLGTKSISANGTYQASSDSLDGYSEVSVNVANSYVAGDEGKVVSNGALVAQTSVTKTANGTYDTTLNNEVVVNVPVSGGSGAIVEPDYQGLAYAYISTGQGFHGSTTKNNYINLFPVIANHKYIIYLGSAHGNIYRVHFYLGKTISDFEQYIDNTSVDTSSVYMYTNNISGSTDLENYSERYIFTPNGNGMIIVGTSNQSEIVPAYCVDTDATPSGGSSVLSGTLAPTSEIGNVGDTYIRYKYDNYIEANGAVKIDTGIDATDVYAVDFEFQPVTLKSSYQDYISSKQDDFTLGAINNLTKAFLRVRGSEKTNNIVVSTEDKTRLRLTNGNILINGYVIATYNTSYPLATNSANVYLFGASNDNRQCNAKVYSLKLYGQNDTLLFDGEPASNNGTAGIYDNVSETFISPSSGTVEFVGGSLNIVNVYIKGANGWDLWEPNGEGE